MDCDPIWAVLLSPDAAPGLSFVTTAVTGADIATGLTFPNGTGPCRKQRPVWPAGAGQSG